MNSYRNLYKRILYLESLLFEGSNNHRDAIFKILGQDIIYHVYMDYQFIYNIT